MLYAVDDYQRGMVIRKGSDNFMVQGPYLQSLAEYIVYFRYT